ncbi:ABC transporter permease [Diaminobutyricibacter sp. McL0608]|uniref:ABC transporter permease n=1 Tax=Leifsonia sp. McL0608 TaxID=3143537 RepID=UPI0031F2DF5D
MLPDTVKLTVPVALRERDETAGDDLRSVEAGLDALQAVDAHPRSTTRRVLRAALPTLALLIALVIAWQIFIVVAHPRPDIVPGPADVAAAFAAAWNSGQLQLAVTTSLTRGATGFVIAIIVATPIGLLLAEVAPLRRAFGPIISGLQVLPSVAWVPAAILWFGLSDGAVYFVVLMGAIPSIVNGLLAGVDQVPPSLRRVGLVLGASRRKLSTKVMLPAALPGYFGGLKQGWAFSWRSLMAAEIIAVGGSMGFGLGSLLQQSRDLADLASVLATVLTILVIGVVVELLVFAPIERGLLSRRGLRPTGSR